MRICELKAKNICVPTFGDKIRDVLGEKGLSLFAIIQAKGTGLVKNCRYIFVYLMKKVKVTVAKNNCGVETPIFCDL